MVENVVVGNHVGDGTYKDVNKDVRSPFLLFVVI